MLDENYNVLMWNHRAEDLWGLRADEVRGKSFLGLDIGLPVGELRPLVRACLSGERDTGEADARRGQPPRQAHPLPRHLHAALDGRPARATASRC